MTLTRHAIATFFASLAFIFPAVAQNFDKAEIKAEQLSPTTYVLYGVGGNIGLSVGDDSVFVIDDQFAPLTEKINAAIRTLTGIATIPAAMKFLPFMYPTRIPTAIPSCTSRTAT